MKLSKRITTLLLALIMVLSCNTFSLSMITDAATTQYINSLKSAGFPDSYATLLAQLHDKHPTWQFEPVLVTQMKPQYTWDYVIDQEMYPTRNLVTTSSWAPSGYDAYYSPYYDKNDTNLYDSGLRQASREAVEYFMDPRNFINEKDVFMFESLEYNSSIHTKAGVEAVLSDTFMASSKGKIDGTNTFADIIYSKGVELNVNPIYLANRIIFEQGPEGRSPLANGTLGTTMWNYYSDTANRWSPTATNSSGQIIWGGSYDNINYTEAELKARDGLYNFYNMGAFGTGAFAIYMNASNECIEEGWTSKAAALSGGIVKVYNRYIAGYQHTPYFQKFNTHPGSDRNFWGQYMQDISGALKAARSAYADYNTTGGLEAAHKFVIPVYGGMPAEACPDPAGGLSYYSPSTAPGSVAATQRYLNIHIESGSGIADFGEGTSMNNAGTIGDTIFFRLIPADGYKVTSLVVNGAAWDIHDPTVEAVYSFTMPAENVDIYVTFTPEYTVNPVELIFDSQISVDWFKNNSVLSEGVQIGLGQDASKNDTYLISKSPATDCNDQYYTINYGGAGLSANTYKYIVITYKTTAANTGAGIYYCAGAVTAPTVDAYQSITWDNDGLWHEYVVDLSSVSKWSGAINSIRLDYFEGDTAANSEIDIRSIRFVSSNPKNAKVTASSTSYMQGYAVTINYRGLTPYLNSLENMKPFIGIYAEGTAPGQGDAIQYVLVSDASGSVTLPAGASGGTSLANLPVGTYTAYLGYDASGQNGAMVNNVISAAAPYTFTVVRSSDVNTDKYQAITGEYTKTGIVVGKFGDTAQKAVTALENTYGTPNITIKNSDGSAVSSSNVISTGMIASVDGNDVSLVVMGDTDGDGAFTVADAVGIMKHVKGQNKLNGVFADAAYVNGYTTVSILNAMYVLNNI
ncbi:MAG: hypothetical protein E7384_04555 [Ruminococcaceae bacterium]|nr:hypothetical protein [Oscillospiraceae bacterium]